MPTRMIVVLLTLGIVTLAQDASDPDSPPAVADKVLAAIESSDAKALATLGARDRVDPWLVANELCIRGSHDAAAEFANATGLEPLAKYVESRRGKKGHEGLASVAKALRAEQWEEALEATERVKAPLDTIAGVRLALARGSALGALGHHAESSEAYAIAAKAARELGWDSNAIEAYDQAGGQALKANDSRGAHAHWEVGLALARERERKRDIADLALNLGQLKAKLRDYDGATSRYEEAIGSYRALGLEEGVAAATLELGQARRRAGDYGAAVAHLQQALALYRELDNAKVVANVLFRLGLVHTSLRKHADALRYFEQALAAFRARKNDIFVGVTLVQIGSAHLTLGNSAEAGTRFREALPVLRATRQDVPLCVALYFLAVTEKQIGNWQSALAAYEDTVVVARRLGRKSQVAIALRCVGDMNGKLGDWGKARTRYRDALKCWRELGRPEEIADALFNVGAAEANLGNTTEGLVAFEEALGSFRKLGDKQGTARTLHHMSELGHKLGRHADVLAYGEEALRLYQALGDQAAIAESLNLLGRFQLGLLNIDRALVHFLAALRIRRQLKDKLGIVESLGGVSTAQKGLGRMPEARAASDEAVKISRELGQAPLAWALSYAASLEKGTAALALREQSLRLSREVGHQNTIAENLVAIAFLQHNLGEDAKAVAACQEVLELTARTPNHPWRQGIFGLLAHTRLKQDRPEEATRLVREGIEIALRFSARLADTEGARVKDARGFLFDVGVHAALASHDVDELAWVLEQGRASSLRQALGSSKALEAAVLPARLRRELAEARHAERRELDRYRKALGAGELEAVAKANTALDEARERVAQIGTRIQHDAKVAASLTLAAPDDLSSIRRHLAEDEALVLYGLTEDEAVAVVVRRSDSRMVRLGGSAEVVKAAGALLAADGHARTGSSRGLVTKSALAPDAAAALRERIVAPLRLTADVKRVLVSPTGLLGYVPFALLLPAREVAFVPSGTVLGLLLEDRPKRGKGVLAIGDPDYGATAEASANLHRNAAIHALAPLPGTRKEVEAVGTVRLMGKHAVESGLQAAIERQERWRAVHFACHGLVDPDRPLLSSLALGADDKDDGFLTAMEVLRTRIPADLVVLSACETGRGTIYMTEGIVGLARAFMFAGAPRIIVSLWKVNDDATAALMIRFYELWRPGKISTAAALKQAQAFVASHDKWKQPYFWAAWQLWGLAD